MTTAKTLYQEIGEPVIRKVITEFYVRAFEDLILAHFFVGKDIRHITAMQIDFAITMLGGPQVYRGKPLVPIHQKLNIRPPHFGRRQVLMREVLDDLKVNSEHSAQWLGLEEQLRPVILRGSQNK